MEYTEGKAFVWKLTGRGFLVLVFGVVAEGSVLVACVRLWCCRGAGIGVGLGASKDSSCVSLPCAWLCETGCS